MSADTSYALLDDALIRLRRLWSGAAPRTVGTADREAPVEMSTIFVVDAIHRLQVNRPEAEVTVTTIAQRLDVAASTASRLIDRAVVASMVTRGTSDTDTRRVSLTLTAPGHALVAEASAYRRSYLARVLDDWTLAEVDTIARLLDRFASDVHQHQPIPATSKEQTL